MSTVEKKTADPYRDSAPPVEDTSPVVGPLAGFAKHEKALAMINVYRQDIAECNTPKSLRELKHAARCDVDIILPKNPKGEVTHTARGSVLNAVTWLHGLTVDDTAYFAKPEDAVPTVPKPGSPREDRLVKGFIAVFAVITFVLLSLWLARR